MKRAVAGGVSRMRRELCDEWNRRVGVRGVGAIVRSEYSCCYRRRRICYSCLGATLVMVPGEKREQIRSKLEW